MQMQDFPKVTDSIDSIQWFSPGKVLIGDTISDLVQKHQQRLQKFGLKEEFPCALVKIWPGKTSGEILQMHMESQNSVHSMLINNVFSMLRELAVKNFRMEELDKSVCEVRPKVTRIVKEAGIEMAGLLLKATMAIPNMRYEPDLSLIEDTDLVMVEKASEDMARIVVGNVSWNLMEDLLLKKKYSNPFDPLIELCKMGLWPLGCHNKQYVVFVPGGKRIRIV